MVLRNPTEVVKVPRPAPEEMRTLSREETQRLLEAARGDKLEALYVLAVHTGMRQGELLALKWQDIDFESATISVRRTLSRSGGRLLLRDPKTKKSRRSIDLTDVAVRALREHHARQMAEIERLGDQYTDPGLVFASEVGTLINPSNLRKRSFAPLCSENSPSYTPISAHTDRFGILRSKYSRAKTRPPPKCLFFSSVTP